MLRVDLRQKESKESVDIKTIVARLESLEQIVNVLDKAAMSFDRRLSEIERKVKSGAVSVVMDSTSEP